MKLKCPFCLGDVANGLEIDPEANEINCPRCGSKLKLGLIYNPVYDIDTRIDHYCEVLKMHKYDIENVRTTTKMTLVYLPYYIFTANGRRICQLKTGDTIDEAVSFDLRGYHHDFEYRVGLVEHESPTQEELQKTRSHPGVVFNSLYAKLSHNTELIHPLLNINAVAQAIQEKYPQVESIVYLPGDEAMMYVEFKVYWKKLETVYGDVADNEQNISRLGYIEETKCYEVRDHPILTICAALKGGYRKVHYSLHNREYMDENSETHIIRRM